ncbi:outer membrane protein [Neokomagataea thailandica NBRC 106555]|uniref:Hedgehog/Intein (Hint) domain-containing protein n=2 Tax=Neokomagataea TaxID=1223423 RepID=A0A4Y6V544_9PROT|nr:MULTISPECIES: Hint domain-containing protein [Neokomagataea]QDH24474.1 hypothetical protein D5366_03580 [Neokomagataea tanensis]GBR55530.1 outer membrane protein [Neokomagataea thailandica NBRC 106555]
MANKTIVVNGVTYQFIGNEYYSGYTLSSTDQTTNLYLEGGTGTSQGAKGSGALLRLSGTQSVSNVIVNSSASVNVGGSATLNNVTLENNGFVQAFRGAKISGGEVKNGGILSIQSGSIVSGVKFDNGSILTIHINSKNFVNTSIQNLDIQQGTIISVIDDSGNALSLGAKIETVNGKKTLYLDTDQGSSNNHQIVIGLNSNSTFSDQSNFSRYNRTDPYSQPYSSSYQELIVCFLAGTEIQTPTGTALVEELKVGDLVNVCDHGEIITDRILWAGKASCEINRDLPDDQAGYPVRILKDAISENIPYQDLLVTAEHCLFFDGKFVPVRMLVNGRSIFYDKSFSSYEYYHIETLKHSVIMANGALTESYLDTGNRSSFRSGNIFFLGHNAKSWEMDAAAPLSTDRSTVEPLFLDLKTRAEKKSFPLQSPEQQLTHEPMLSLLTDTGSYLEPIRTSNGHHVFIITSDVRSVRILSRASRPCDVMGPYWDDRRLLGVAISAAHIFEWNRKTHITSYQTLDTLEGWHTLEADTTTRWTSGNAVLPLERNHPEEQAILSLKIQPGTYLIDDAERPTMHERLTA